MAVKIHAGDLKRSVVLMQPTFSRNSQAGKEASYEATVTVRAKVDTTNTRLQEIAPALLHTDTIYFRYAEDRKDLTDKWRLQYNGRICTIHSVEFLGREKNSFIKVIAKAIG